LIINNYLKQYNSIMNGNHLLYIQISLQNSVKYINEDYIIKLKSTFFSNLNSFEKLENLKDIEKYFDVITNCKGKNNDYLNTIFEIVKKSAKYKKGAYLCTITSKAEVEAITKMLNTRLNTSNYYFFDKNIDELSKILTYSFINLYNLKNYSSYKLFLKKYFLDVFS